MPYKVHPPPPSARTILPTFLPLLFHLPPLQAGHLLSHHTPGVGVSSLCRMPTEGEAQTHDPCHPLDSHQAPLVWRQPKTHAVTHPCKALGHCSTPG